MIVALNNKCNFDKESFISYQDRLGKLRTNSTLILCPTFLNIGNFNLSNCYLGAQNVSFNNDGAHTGEISASQLKTYNVKYCIVGHSERRSEEKETNEEISLKISNLYKEGIIPILCVGETKEERLSNKVSDVIKEEISIATMNLTEEEKSKLIIAYEPIWSIGTGLIPTNAEIEEVFKLIKSLCKQSKVLYGGSANENNIDELKQNSLIDGYLLGGLSLKPENLQMFLEKLEK